MELYETTAYKLAQQLTERYSTSFSLSSTLFADDIRRHIYAIYAMVRIADEIVDTYPGADAGEQFEAFYSDVIRTCAMAHPYSTNPLVYAFACTANQYGITQQLIDPFFDSMRMDLTPKKFTKQTFETYIYGSAAVVGLMCLRVFTGGDDAEYAKLAPGAQRLGNAYQKVNFLRDFAADTSNLKRHYFPGVEDLSEENKHRIIDDIQADFDTARPSVTDLPASARRAVLLSFRYYETLLDRLRRTPAETLRTTRIRVPAAQKFALYVKTRAGL